MKFKSLKDIGEIKGKVVILRLETNVPIIRGKIAETFRLDQSIPTINFLQDRGAKTLIIGHIESKETDSLQLIFEYFKELDLPIVFASDLMEAKEKLLKCKEGEIVILDNLRKWEEEKKNDENFAKEITSLADFYVNEAFSVSHRKHSSIVGMPKFLPSFCGFLFEREVANLSRAFNPERPFLFVLGGAKVATKLPLLRKFLKSADILCLGGVILNDFLKAKGYEIGQSNISDGNNDLVEELKNPKLFLPFDVVAVKNDVRTNKSADTVEKDESIMDIGKESIERICEYAKTASFVLWNGPFGYYERGYTDATEKFAKTLSESKAISIVGGGDTVAVVNKLGLSDKFTFISTAGGAMLDFLAGETLPGIEALENSK